MLLNIVFQALKNRLYDTRKPVLDGYFLNLKSKTVAVTYHCH